MTQSELLVFVALVLPLGVCIWVGALLLVLHLWREVVSYVQHLQRMKEHKKQEDEWRRKTNAGDYTK